MQEKIDDLMLKNPEIASDISPNDPVGVMFGKEYLGRVRGFSFRACPTPAFKQCPTARLSGINFASSSGTSSNMDDKFVKMESDLATVKNQMNQMQKVLAYVASREDILEPLAAMVVALVHPSSNEWCTVSKGCSTIKWWKRNKLGLGG
ncbi:hypothetical protein DEO72_LG6g779 [Vigna unguiculata]|uniref:Uncharacterized protein n=1 Tax=Vigna unguiculata TaxID=3917 RepID=A0A4D6M5G7_VIGUN|nr:hypothetical protein DEO72_LG6g779 [Vigna unguiculata]